MGVRGLSSDESEWPAAVVEFVMSLYDLAYSPGSNEDRFSLLAANPMVQQLRMLLPSHEERIPINSLFFRARRGGIADGAGTVVAYAPSNGYGQSPRKQEGRANYNGQACLYCSTAEDTAVIETRPKADDPISVCELRTSVELRIVDLEVARTRRGNGGTDPEQVLAYLALRMAEPVEEMEGKRYLPTQLIAELCRAEEFDGLSYSSVAGGTGKNIALFSIDFVVFCKSWLSGTTCQQSGCA
jgi:hypothetical protein